MHSFKAFADAKSSFCFAWLGSVGNCHISKLLYRIENKFALIFCLSSMAEKCGLFSLIAHKAKFAYEINFVLARKGAII